MQLERPGSDCPGVLLCELASGEVKGGGIDHGLRGARRGDAADRPTATRRRGFQAGAFGQPGKDAVRHARKRPNRLAAARIRG
ncbi:hypothetical protein [Mangrovibrevibacter kandeliae]|uniref:hypothetical protein n=1 Tax=Mangrovibrevibacter kandeliae TaxID=2968473 RepID=UPI0021198A9D|nr:hypothetical protein [Aurantimonas sp. CSK15Z-1]MCQ8782244.1 hypothetical protein [Aurantimonas sp. CSK15Z-1]